MELILRWGKDRQKAAGVTIPKARIIDRDDMPSNINGGEMPPVGPMIERRDPDIAFNLHVWVRFGIEKIATAVSMYPLAVNVRDPERQDDPAVMAKIKTIRKLLNNPNVFDSRQDWLAQTSIDLCLLRVACNEVIRWNATGEPAELLVVPPKTIRVNLDAAGRIADPARAFTQIVAGAEGATFGVNDLLYFRLLPKSGQFIPTSPIATLQNALVQDGYAIKFNMDSLRHGNTVRQIITLGSSDGSAAPDANEVQAEWDKKHADGKSNRRITFVSGADIKSIPVDRTLEDMQWSDQQKYCVRQVSTAFGIPLMYFGWPDDTKYANAEAEEKRFAQYTILPIVNAICDKLNQYLLPQFGLDPDEDAVITASPELLSITELDLKREEKDQRTGVYTVNDIRRKRGDSEVAWGDDYSFTGTAYIPIPGTQAAIDAEDKAQAQAQAEAARLAAGENTGGQPGKTPITQGSAPGAKPERVPAPSGQGEEQGPQKKAWSAARRRVHVGKYIENAIKPQLTATAKALIRPIRGAVKAIAAQIRALTPEQAAALAEGAKAGIERPITRRKLLDFTDNLDLGETMDEIAEVLEQGFRAGYATGRVGAGAAFGIRATMREPIVSLVDSLKPAWKEVGEKMKFALIKDAQDVLIDGLAQGMTSGQIADELVKNILGETMRNDGRIVFHDGTDGRKPYSMTPENWAEVTSQSLVSRAANYGISESLIDAGIRMKEWVTMGDERVREEHRANERQGAIPMEMPFENGELFPGEAPNCRCYLAVPETELRRIGYTEEGNAE